MLSTSAHSLGDMGRLCHSCEPEVLGSWGPGVLGMAVLMSTTHIDSGVHVLPTGVDPAPCPCRTPRPADKISPKSKREVTAIQTPCRRGTMPACLCPAMSDVSTSSLVSDRVLHPRPRSASKHISPQTVGHNKDVVGALRPLPCCPNGKGNAEMLTPTHR